MYYFRRLKIPKILNIFTPHFRWQDLSDLKFSDYIYAFKRIFFHTYFISNLFPTCIFRRLFFQNGKAQLVVPSQRLKYYYDNLLGKPVCRFIPPGGDPDSINKDNTQKLPSNNGNILILHSGLASILRGLDDLSIAYSGLPEELKKRAKLIFALYCNKEEKISSCKRIQKLLSRQLSPDDYSLILNPLSDIHSLFEKVDIGVFPYRYPGDIPEVPLTIVELLYKGKLVISNRIGCLEEWLGDDMLIRPGDIIGLRGTLKAAIEKMLGGNNPPYGRWSVSWDEYYSRYQEILAISPNRSVARSFFDRESVTYEERVLEGSPGVIHISQVEKEIIEGILSNCPSGLYLDIGIGTGRFIPLIQSLGSRIVGADISLKMLKIHKGRINLSAGTVSSLPFRDESFDGIVSMRTMKYVASIHAALKEFHRVLKQGGFAIVQFANKITYQYLLKLLCNLGDKEYNQILQLHSHKELEKYILRAGFTIVSVEKTVRIPFFIYARFTGPRTLNIFRAIETGLDKIIPGSFLSRDYVYFLKK